jgi:hypothetical protein
MHLPPGPLVGNRHGDLPTVFPPNAVIVLIEECRFGRPYLLRRMGTEYTVD